MIFGKPGAEGGGTAKGSIFSALSPAPAAPPKPEPKTETKPAPAPAPPPPPPVDVETVAALKQKIDMLEINIVSRLEKKIGEQFRTHPAPTSSPCPPPPPPVRAPETDLLCQKIEEMERRLSDFNQAVVVSSSQLKNIEESKISARREIEDLLKAVREQQKYSELDRQMHEQLERAWTRAEELEKKLMEFYSSVMELETRRRDDAVRVSDKTSSAMELLAKRLEVLEKKISDAALPSELRVEQQEFFRRAEETAQRQAVAQEAWRTELTARVNGFAASTPVVELRAAQEEFFVRMREEAKQQASAQEALRLEMISSVRESSQSYKEVFENYMRTEMGLLRDKIFTETEALRREMAAVKDESRKILSEQSAYASQKVVEFEGIAKANALKADAVSGALDAAARRQAAALEEFSLRLQAEARTLNADFAAAMKAENDARFVKFGAKYADALLSATFVENFRAAVSGALEKFENYGTQLEAFLKEVDPARLEKNTGVSGMIARRQFDAMVSMLETLRADTARLRAVKRGVEEKFGDIFKED